MKYYYTLFISFFFLPLFTLDAQEIPNSTIKEYIVDFKKDPRGPYHRIRWFCNDGSIREPRDPCPDSIGGGIQHASYKQDVLSLAKKNKLYFGQILAATDNGEFWDHENNQSRLKQYQIGRYLASVDDGWIMRRAQFYRGAIQSEDEQAWGIDFYKELFSRDSILKKHYYLLRQSLRDVPHSGDTNVAQDMRSQSKVISEAYAPFMDARIKIHGKPEPTDITMVRKFLDKQRDKLTPGLIRDMNELLKTMEEFHSPVSMTALAAKVEQVQGDNLFTQALKASLMALHHENDAETIVKGIADMLCEVRENVTSLEKPEDRLMILDMSIDLENELIKQLQDWNPDNIRQLLEKIYTLSYASMGSGLIEAHEWEAVNDALMVQDGQEEISMENMLTFQRAARSVVEWSAAMVKAVYGTEVNRYSEFEPLARTFLDDRIRSSVSLGLGESVSRLGDYISLKSSLENKVFNIADQGAIRGLNPGYAKGTLVVVAGDPEAIEVETDKIYVFQRPPADLKPVAGIMTVSEGNLVSHVQLLARNLGIPNAALSETNLQELRSKDGTEVFYAVTPAGNVVMKSAANMTAEENQLFSSQSRNSNKITVPTENINTAAAQVLSLREVDADDSGALCGPKAANLGELKKLFPEHVVEGLVIPFGIFRQHMEHPMPGKDLSYWEFLTRTFKEADQMRQAGSSEKQVEEFQLSKLKVLADAIRGIKLSDEFTNALEEQFKDVLGGSMGDVPVFLRSDTNMEDLKEFTGAGLNLTLFNILEREKILQGVKNVWASPYSERSFKWRQSYLLNPENVYPSILIIPSVDVDYSGVMITKGINVGTEEDLTVAFSRGAGGAVDGQSAETYLITDHSWQLLSPARQPDYIRLPVSGGVQKHYATYEEPILNPGNIESIRAIASEIRKKIPETQDASYQGAYDVELGFRDNKLWLFQIRPFVENNNARTSEYLNSISPEKPDNFKIELDTKI
ncbi:PEP/pyruvate-binding domain-containing protein [Zeaxanthinibacter sp. PT1]|uniref:PEP/pyruvate-binding domain-containing protein n=1 Tax=Zeaxanthinibacter TaxID=561554 RepID=UPI00234947FF|nr:PEP/pyruvate-binding domain-containing protein [Zeaxanthinibacter sp. PT1]MDC6351490.1 PEP/pyruvate-binding domain-containing protein [Zeaxanthinibacter sp. PT1]